jgi:predicted DNA-binding transcriptional regulator AlpA
MNSQSATPYPDLFLDTNKAAKYLGLKSQTLCNWRSMKIGPSYVILGRRAIRYRLSDLEKYAESRITATE